MITDELLVIIGYMEGFKQTNRVFDPEGIAPTVLSRDYKDPIRIIVEKDDE